MKKFKFNKPNYYLEVVRAWEFHSYSTNLKCMTYAHPVFIVKKRNFFKKDEIIKAFYYTSAIEEALDYVRQLNGSDFISNEEGIKKYDNVTKWNYDEVNKGYDSGKYIIKK